MAGPNLEVLKFGFYLFFPIATLVHYGNPAWYQKHVIPVKNFPLSGTIFAPLIPRFSLSVS